MEFRDCNQATVSGAGKGAAVEGAGDRPAHLNFHAKGNEVPPIASRNRPWRDDRDIELSTMQTLN